MGKATRWLKGLFFAGGSGGGGGGGKKAKWVFTKSSNKAREDVGGGFVSKREEGDGDDQNKRAIAVAAATAAMAEAAVAAAHAAAAVARLTSSGRVCGAVDGGGRRTEEWAAVTIQSVFRGHLARKALKALKGLVKVQALVRGRITRKQTAEALRYMQELFRVQAREHACRVLADRLRPGGGSASATHHHRRHRKATGRSFDYDSLQYSSSGWLDQWMEERYMVSHETPSRAAGTSATDDDKNAKILEIDPGKPHPFASHRHHSMSSDPKNIRSFVAAVTDSPSKDSTVAHGSDSSPSSVGNHLFVGGSHESPQHLSSRRAVGGPLTPSKSECTRSVGGGWHPSYMAYTQSSRAKARSQSAPKHRPCFGRRVTTTPPPRRPGSGGWQSSSSSSSASHGPHLGLTGKAYPGSGRLDRMGMPL